MRDYFLGCTNFRFFDPRLLIMEKSEQSYLYDSNCLFSRSRRLDICCCCTYFWNTRNFKICTTITSSMLPGMYLCCLTGCWTLTVMLTVFNNAVNNKKKNYVSVLCVCLNASLALIHFLYNKWLLQCTLSTFTVWAMCS